MFSLPRWSQMHCLETIHRNCTINVQVYNSPIFQQCPFQGMAITTQAYEDSEDDLLVDSVLCDTDYDV